MRLLYYTKPPFLDCDLPYLKSQKENISELYTIIDLPSFFLRSSVLDIAKQISKPGIFKASQYKEIIFFEDYLDLDKTYVVNRTNKKVFSVSNLILNFKLFFFILKIRPTIIHSTVFYDFQELFLYFFRKKTIVTVHDPFPHSGEGNFRKYFFRKLGFTLLNNFIILNKKQKTQFIATYKLENKNVYESNLSIYNVYNLYLGQFSENKPLKSILFFGRISPYKGINILLEAMKYVHSIHPDVKLIIAGNGEYYFDKTEFEQLDYIEFRNRYIPNAELVKLIKDSLFVVCPYIDATQSGVVMTSYAFCKPVIASNIGGLSEMVIDKVTGCLVEPNDIIELQNSIIELVSNKKLLDTMEKNVFDHFHQGQRGWTKISKDLFIVYNTIINDNKK
ncbi:glycosyltransferase family 4 protein [Flavobacterium franklandianum]|uniref:Glycosyltransferase family 4 protein n=1 Tax=Flavobacterium franklandianum TaxID=2594430 RepID=A0A553CJ99_9FLAO|nr:glycosyltransferase family 4 protein [Flavobacterium franklandianum]TRX20573.1 glycosyltransferase family 4 protein [Flavobacterium franklandianum]TRX29431.1 glycosyltransferase family 4 protein [Flavobacterium franklandianum]